MWTHWCTVTARAFNCTEPGQAASSDMRRHQVVEPFVKAHRPGRYSPRMRGSLRPESVVLAVGEEVGASLRVVAGGKGVGHDQRGFGIDVLAYHDDLAEAAADVIVPDEAAGP